MLFIVSILSSLLLYDDIKQLIMRLMEPYSKNKFIPYCKSSRRQTGETFTINQRYAIIDIYAYNYKQNLF